ncbi:MAG TPA: MFS transporter [Fimbriimonas sp.]
MAEIPAPAPAPSRLETLGTLKNANLDMAFATAFVTLTTGAFLVGFVQKLGGSAFWVNLLAAIPSLIGILQIPGAIWGRGFRSYRNFVFGGGAIWRFFYLLIVFLPLMPLPNEAKLSALVLFVALGSTAVILINPIYNDWLAELVPSNSRGYFFSKRNAIATAVGATVGFGGGKVLDLFRARGQEDLGFSVVYGIAFLCSALSMFFFLRMRDIERPNPIRQSIKEGIKAVRAPFSDHDFRKVLLFLGAAVFGQGLAGNLFVAYARESLELSYTIILATGVMHAVGSIVALRLWGYVSDKYGNRPLLLILSFGLSFTPVVWLFTFPGRDTYNAVLLLVSHVFMGVVWSGLALTQFNLLLATAKASDRANYIAAGMATSSLVGGIAPLVGAALFTTFNTSVDTATAYKFVFSAASFFRLVTVFFLRPVREEGSSDVAHTLRVLGGMTPRGIIAMRGLARGTDAHSRAAAIENVGEIRVGLASDEVIKALHDPQPRVRRQAARTLSQLRDPRAVGELVHQIEEHPDLVEEETVVALGYLGDVGAIPALVKTLQSPRSILRRAAARALGRIGSPEGTQPLISAAMEPNDPDLRRAALQALRQIGAAEAEPAMVAALEDQHPSVRIAAAEAIAELELRGAAQALRQCLTAFRDEASSEIAYALGVVGTTDDLEAILDEARASTSMITRRRCLLGIASLLGVEQAFYRLLLLEGMERDAALLESTRAAMRRNRKLAVALERYASGDEEGALHAVARALPMPELAILAAKPVSELFLVSVVYAMRK